MFTMIGALGGGGIIINTEECSTTHTLKFHLRCKAAASDPDTNTTDIPQIDRFRGLSKSLNSESLNIQLNLCVNLMRIGPCIILIFE